MSKAVPKRSVIVAGHRTSVSLEDPFWNHIKEIARLRGKSINEFITDLEASATIEKREGNLSSWLRLCVLQEMERRLADRVSGSISIPSPRIPNAPGRSAG